MLLSSSEKSSMLQIACSACRKTWGLPSGTPAGALLAVVALTSLVLARETRKIDLTFIEPHPASASSKAVVVMGTPTLAHTSQLLPLDENGKLVGKDRPAEQIDRVLGNLALLMTSQDSQLDALVKLNVYVKQDRLAADFSKALVKKLPKNSR